MIDFFRLDHPSPNGASCKTVRRPLSTPLLIAGLTVVVSGCEWSEGPLLSGHTSESSRTGPGAEEVTCDAHLEAGHAGLLKVGDKAPDFQVEVLGGESLRLSSHLRTARGPTVLIFDRAHW